MGCMWRQVASAACLDSCNTFGNMTAVRQQNITRANRHFKPIQYTAKHYTSQAHLHALLHIGHLYCACCVPRTTHQPHLLASDQVARHACCIQAVSDLQ